jgi:hypothetical protein
MNNREDAVEAAAKRMGIDLTAIKNRQISVDANAYLNIKPDRWDARNAYVDRRDLLRLVTELRKPSSAGPGNE